MSFSIRTGRLSDAQTVVAFNQFLASESEGKTLDPEILRGGVEAVLADGSRGSYFLAVENQQIIGQLMITREWSDWRNGWLLWIQSVYVAVEHRRKGVFRSLYQHVQKLAKDDPEVKGLRLYVEEHNSSAQSTYHQLGMKHSGYHVLEEIFGT